tara:strand:- start:16 stop:780 length:765 start_codon:yes stop_codon:yes gene_type:complete
MKVNFPHEINVQNLTFSEPKPFGENGAKIVYIKNDDSEVNIQCPQMGVPFGINKYDDGSRVKYTLEMSFRGKEENTRIEKLHDFLNEVDQHVLNYAAKNSVSWFKKKMSKEVLKELITPSVKYSKDKETGELTDKYPPTFKVKVPWYEGRFTKPAFNINSLEQFDSDWGEILTKGTNVQAIVSHGGIWFAGGKFGSLWQIQQVKIQPSDRLVKYAFRDDDDDENNTTNETQSEESSPKENTEYVLDSEAEDDEL